MTSLPAVVDSNSNSNVPLSVTTHLKEKSDMTSPFMNRTQYL